MAMKKNLQPPRHFQKTEFDRLPGWNRDDHQAALQSFLRFCAKPKSASIAARSAVFTQLTPDELTQYCVEAHKSAVGSKNDARRFLEDNFTPFRISKPGFVTGYFEPELVASRVRTDRFTVPLHTRPDGVVAITEENRPRGWPPHLSHGRKAGTALLELPDRGAIMAGALDAENLELVWLEDPIDAYFVHVQGSARLRLQDGSVMRVGYAGKSGHPYTGIGRLLVERGEGTPEDFTMDGLRTWLAVDPERRDALFRENRSYIFFREVHESEPEQGPVGAAGLPLIAGRSLAIDPAHISYGALVFVSSEIQDSENPGRSFARLMVADDTGSAIKGPARGDIFVGSGERAGQIAGNIRHRAEFTVLIPKPGYPVAGQAMD